MSAGRHPWWLGLAARAAAVLLLALGRTWRIERGGLAARDAGPATPGVAGTPAAGQRCIFALWHARLLPLVFTHRHRGAVVLVSRHRDGELIARIIERLGYRTARGSSTRGGGEGARAMLSYAAQGALLAITPDGPRGPAERVKPGLVYLASRSGLPVLPVAAAASRAWVFRSWDGFRVPRPFARVVVDYGAPIEVPGDLDRAAAERWRVRLEEALHALTADVARRAGEPAAPPAAERGGAARAVEGA